ncbi:MAG: hypothetical protein IPM34_05335 [Saprospiraceae bacterium]|nr:hypothetical protein [Saprospiraceae bacterium]
MKNLVCAIFISISFLVCSSISFAQIGGKATFEPPKKSEREKAQTALANAQKYKDANPLDPGATVELNKARYRLDSIDDAQNRLDSIGAAQKKIDSTLQAQQNKWHNERLLRELRDSARYSKNPDTKALADLLSQHVLRELNKNPGQNPAKILDSFIKAHPHHNNKPLIKSLTQRYELPRKPNLKIKPTGTGQTTGHIADLEIHNNSPFSVDILPQTFYIRSWGKYQSYIGRIIVIVTIPPGSTITIPVYGYCANVRTPPVGSGEPMPPVSEWIPVGDLDIPKKTGNGVPVTINDRIPLPSFTTATIPSITTSGIFIPKSTEQDSVFITWPGTDIPVNGFITSESKPEVIAPVLVSALEFTENAATIVISSGEYKNPFESDPSLNYSSSVQQTFWRFTSAFSGDEYKEQEFAENVYSQFETNTQTSVSSLPDDQKKELDKGIKQFWTTYTAIGLKAKVLKVKPEDQEPPVEISEKTGGCEGAMDLKIKPPYQLEMKIASEWGTPEERQALIQAVRDSLAKNVKITGNEAFQSYDINRHPTSSTSFWKAGHVGGFASAYAKTYFKRPDGTWEWVWGTDQLETKASGSMDFSMKYTHDETCRALVAGAALIRIRASSSAFDAMAGNTNLENNTDQLNFLRTTKYFGKKAAEWLILKARGRAKTSFNQFITDDIRDQIKGAISDAVMAEVQALADKALGGLLNEMGISLDQMLNMELPSLEELLEKLFGVDIPSIKDLTDFIEKGLEAAFNLPFVANTYATANGGLTVRVGGNVKSVLASTSVHYARKATEETKEAMTYTGEKCDEAFVSDAQPDALNINTQGFSNMVAEAVSKYGFGNGQAEAFLESMNLQILSGICICPAQRRGIDQSSYKLNVQGKMEWYTADEGQQKDLETALESMLQGVEDQMIKELDAMSVDQVNNLTEDQFEQMLAKKVRAWGDANKFAWRSCRSKS